jgi:hypothetical protein
MAIMIPAVMVTVEVVQATDPMTAAQDMVIPVMEIQIAGIQVTAIPGMAMLVMVNQDMEIPITETGKTPDQEVTGEIVVLVDAGITKGIMTRPIMEIVMIAGRKTGIGKTGTISAER